MSLDLEDDKMCFVCGEQNKRGLHLEFAHPKPGFLSSHVTFGKHYQGYKNIVHGGLIGTVLDEMMVNLAWVEGKPAVTAEFKVSLKKPIKVGERIHLEGHLVREKGKVLYTRAEAKNEKGEVVASADGVCVRIRLKVH